MNPRLREHFHTLCARAARDTEATVNALGYLIWLDALGDKPPIARATVTALSRRAERALLDLQQPADGSLEGIEDHTHAVGSVAQLLRVGLRILNGGRANVGEFHATTLHPPSGTLARMLEAKADGLTAGRYGLHVLGCERCRSVIAALPTPTHKVALDAPMLLAASPSTHVRAPEGGRVLARIKTPPSEAVLFNDRDSRRLAVYATSTDAVRIVAEGVTTEDTRPGYWIGRIDGDVSVINATIHYAATGGAQSRKLKLPLADTTTSARRKRATRKPTSRH